MTEQTKTPQPGDVIHIRGALSITLGDNLGRSFSRGEELTLTPEIIENAKDPNGNSWLTLTPQQQVEKWGSQKFGWGPCSPEITWWNTPGDIASHDVARIQARDRAAAISDPTERAAAWEQVREEFGTPATSWSTGS